MFQARPTSLSVSSVALLAIDYTRLRSILHASLGRNRPTEGPAFPSIIGQPGLALPLHLKVPPQPIRSVYLARDLRAAPNFSRPPALLAAYFPRQTARDPERAAAV